MGYVRSSRSTNNWNITLKNKKQFRKNKIELFHFQSIEILHKNLPLLLWHAKVLLLVLVEVVVVVVVVVAVVVVVLLADNLALADLMCTLWSNYLCRYPKN